MFITVLQKYLTISSLGFQDRLLGIGLGNNVPAVPVSSVEFRFPSLRCGVWREQCLLQAGFLCEGPSRASHCAVGLRNGPNWWQSTLPLLACPALSGCHFKGKALALSGMLAAVSCSSVFHSWGAGLISVKNS